MSLKSLINLITLSIILFLSNTTRASSLNRSFNCLPAFYEKLSYSSKEEIIYNDCILETEYVKLPSLSGLGWFSILKSIKGMITLDRSFAHSSDEMPKGRKKIIHTYGSTALVEFVSSKNSPYTGIFKGARGVARISLASSPKMVGVVPGLAVKFFITDRPSVNIHVMNSVNGQGDDKNLFLLPFSNIIPKAKGLALMLLQKWFSLFVKNPNRLNVNHLSFHQQDGRLETSPLWPHKIEFRPTEVVQMDSFSQVDFRVDLKNITPGLKLYDVYGYQNQNTKNPTKIGELILQSRFVASGYGDERLFFKHNE